MTDEELMYEEARAAVLLVARTRAEGLEVLVSTDASGRIGDVSIWDAITTGSSNTVSLSDAERMEANEEAQKAYAEILALPKEAGFSLLQVKQ